MHVLGDFNGRQRNDASFLTRDDHGHCRGFIPAVRDRDRYLFYVVGDGSEGPKRDLMHASSRHRFRANASSASPIFPGTRADTSLRDFTIS